LIAPTLAALANEPSLLVVVTAGGRPVAAIPGPIPSNARLASYLPFEWILPKVDVFVTNGGYGSVNQAMSFGIPLVAAGLTEDKADVNARVAWSGVGIDLATNEPTPQALCEAIRTVLDKPNYSSRASLMADEFAEIDARSEILRILGEISHVSDKDGLPHAKLRKVSSLQPNSSQITSPNRLSVPTRRHIRTPPECAPEQLARFGPAVRHRNIGDKRSSWL
jgi:UDP-glucoronosyl and UDP-glucosyl transferase